MGAAFISPCQQYRYVLTREPRPGFTPSKGRVLFIMLNPSTADAALDDPTIRRCKNFAELWGCAGIMVGNLYAFRATKPKDLWTAADPVGPDNDVWLRRQLFAAGLIVCAWGANAKPDRVNSFTKLAVDELGFNLYCLGTTKDGSPRHPLYVRNDQPLIPWHGGATRG